MSVRAHTHGNSRQHPRRRPAPRRDAGRPGSGRIHWDRFGRVLFVLVVALLLIATLKPTWNAVHSYRQAGAAKERLRQVQVEHAALERQVKRARSEATLQREARRQGMIKPGEQAWVVNGIK